MEAPCLNYPPQVVISWRAVERLGVRPATQRPTGLVLSYNTLTAEAPGVAVKWIGRRAKPPLNLDKDRPFMLGENDAHFPLDFFFRCLTRFGNVLLIPACSVASLNSSTFALPNAFRPAAEFPHAICFLDFHGIPSPQIQNVS